MKPDKLVSIGVVVIGRNEGQRLEQCLDSITKYADRLVYVDSGSSDGSPAMTRAAGIDTIKLDADRAFTAARSRNAGYQHLRQKFKQLEFVQFIDGDCIVDADWIATAENFLSQRADIAVVCGRLRERFPHKTVYNLICDMEWDLPTGETRSSGGNAFMRVQAFDQSGGFREDLIAGEEPELCMRMRESGWKIWRLAEEMVLHDADMTRFSQWWLRSVRAGHSFAEGVHQLGRDCSRERNRALIWGLCIPVGLILISLIAGPLALLIALVYPLQVLRLARRQNFGFSNNLIYAFYETLGKFAEAMGVLKYHLNRLTGKSIELIEYK